MRARPHASSGHFEYSQGISEARSVDIGVDPAEEQRGQIGIHNRHGMPMPTARPEIQRIGISEGVMFGEVLEHHARLREDKVSVNQQRYHAARCVLIKPIGLLPHHGLAQIGWTTQML